MTETSVARRADGRARDPRDELMWAARDALALLERMDAHAPEGLSFGGEARVRRRLREAIRRADGPPAPNPRDYESSEAFEAAEARHWEELRTGRMMGDGERGAFERGFLEARAESRR